MGDRSPPQIQEPSSSTRIVCVSRPPTRCKGVRPARPPWGMLLVSSQGRRRRAKAREGPARPCRLLFPHCNDTNSYDYLQSEIKSGQAPLLCGPPARAAGVHLFDEALRMAGWTGRARPRASCSGLCLFPNSKQCYISYWFTVHQKAQGKGWWLDKGQSKSYKPYSSSSPPVVSRPAQMHNAQSVRICGPYDPYLSHDQQ